MLQKALADSQNVHANLDEFMNWLDTTERDVHKLDKGTVVVAKKAPIQENMQQGAVSYFKFISFKQFLKSLFMLD